MDQEGSFPSSDAALLLKLKQVTFFWLHFYLYRMWIVISFAKYFQTYWIYVFWGEEGLSTAFCVLCVVQEEEGWCWAVFACTGIGSVPTKHTHSFGHCRIHPPTWDRRDGTMELWSALGRGVITHCGSRARLALRASEHTWKSGPLPSSYVGWPELRCPRLLALFYVQVWMHHVVFVVVLQSPSP